MEEIPHWKLMSGVRAKLGDEHEALAMASFPKIDKDCFMLVVCAKADLEYERLERVCDHLLQNKEDVIILSVVEAAHRYAQTHRHAIRLLRGSEDPIDQGDALLVFMDDDKTLVRLVERARESGVPVRVIKKPEPNYDPG